jgi:flagellum-specific ATP synthase
MLESAIANAIENIPKPKVYGKVVQSVGLLVEAECPQASIGEFCEIVTTSGMGDVIGAEVIGFKDDKALIMPYRKALGVSYGSVIRLSGRASSVPVGDELLGRVVNAFGEPIDDKGSIDCTEYRTTYKHAINPLKREPISEILETGVRAIDGFTTIGKGQRLGLMAGSGVGKSTLLSGICQHVNADINIVALIGERGREVEEFVHQILSEKGLEKTVVIAATAQESPIIRTQAAQMAMVLAEYFADKGKSVFFTMDSVTRYATALREIGLAAGEPPTVKGYTPSVFSAIPDLIERCGNFVGKGSISAIFTVLVESDDFNDPVVDTVRAILDGHIILSRELAEQGHYPAIDISKSLSRLFNQLNEKSHTADSRVLRKIFNDYQQNKDILELGLFEQEDTEDRDRLIEQWKLLENLLVQDVSEKSVFNKVVERISLISKEAS